ETAVLTELAAETNVVIATGGGIILREENRSIMKSAGHVCYLTASIDQLVERTSRDKKRPLLQVDNPHQKIIDLLALRDPLYRAAADSIINTDRRSPKAVAQEIAGLVTAAQRAHPQLMIKCVLHISYSLSQANLDMRQLNVDLGDRSYPIYIGENLLVDGQYILPHIRGRQVCIVTNETIAPLYLPSLQNLLHAYQVDSVVLPDGESFKNLETLNLIFDGLLSARHNRTTTLIALGGGVVGDMTGFAAACYQRGVDFIQIPTTLLSMVDSSVGGKTGVNHALGKNMIGAFYQPRC